VAHLGAAPLSPQALIFDHFVEQKFVFILEQGKKANFWGLKLMGNKGWPACFNG